jgi:sugar phosphate isomerase/epimerase
MGFIISGFSDEIATDFQKQLEVVKSLNMDYIEIRGVNGRSIVEHTLEEVHDIKRQLDIANIKISAIASPIGKIKITDEFEPHFELFKHTIDIANILMCKNIRLFSFFVKKGEAGRYRVEVMNRMKKFCDYVEDKDILLLHENEKDIFGDVPKRCLDIVKTMNSDKLKLIFDPANFIQCQVETYPKAYELLKDEVVYYHMKDALLINGNVVPSGYGDGHIPEIIEELIKANYHGFLSLEPHLGYFEGFNQLEGNKDALSFEEKSDASKFKLAYDSLQVILEDKINE